MEEIIKRLQILKLSIALKDFDSIDLQISRLEKLNVNQQVHNIIALIKNRQFYHALMSINAYPNDLYSSEYYSKVRAEEEAVIDEFDLFESGGKPTEPTVVAKAPVVEKIEDETEVLEELKAQEEKVEKEYKEVAKEQETQGVVKNSWFIEDEEQRKPLEEKTVVKIDDKSEERQVEESLEPQELTQEAENLNQEKLELEDETHQDEDTKEDEPTNNYNSWYEENKIVSQIDTSNPLSYTKDYTFDEPKEEREPNTYDHNLIMDDDLDDIAKDYYRQKLEEDIDKVKYSKEDDTPAEDESFETAEESVGMDEDGFYKPMQFLDQKFASILNRFPQKESIESDLDSIKHIVSLFEQPYSEGEVDIALKQLDEFKKNEEYEEAAKILLVVANTESKNAHFRLARELFKGDVLEQNYPEAFIQMNDLALDGYVEAICDLGQFYEYGIGIKKDRKKALSLYQEAHELGLERAKELHDKLENTKKNFFSYLFN
ncbi:MAG: tetratricopeptide repeat protein [Campylobacterota bacterium]|nr:tetratricopeptide repeat protein [Campylobacterota bacterium]